MPQLRYSVVSDRTWKVVTMSDKPKPWVDRYLGSLTEAGILEDLAQIPKRDDYDSTEDWMRALEAYRDGQLAPPREEEQS